MDVSVSFIGQARSLPSAARYVRDLLIEVDDEFVPALSKRDSTTSKDFTPIDSPTNLGFEAYVHQTLTEQCLVARLEDDFAGFMTFLPHHRDPLIERWGPSTYVVTVAVGHNFRRHGVAAALYSAALTLPSKIAAPFIATRTWALNTGHIGLLGKLGFKEVARLENDRGVGTDTVYFARPTVA
jgi:GNAT superfamily N-acetyltransferase